MSPRRVRLHENESGRGKVNSLAQSDLVTRWALVYSDVHHLAVSLTFNAVDCVNCRPP